MKRLHTNTLVLAGITATLFAIAAMATSEFKQFYVDMGIDLPNITMWIIKFTPTGWICAGVLCTFAIVAKDFWLRRDLCENINVFSLIFLVILTIFVAYALFLPLVFMCGDGCLARGG